MNQYLLNLARNDDEKRLLSRVDELLQKASQGRTLCSDFLDIRQQELAQAVMDNEASIGWCFEGGYPDAERKRLLIYPDWEDEAQAGIACLKIKPQAIGPVDLGHRDYLGALLNLGISRTKLGDIVLQNEAAFVFVEPNLSDYICQQLSRVKHSSVTIEQFDPDNFIFRSPALKTIKVSLASLRLDAAIAAAYNLSRSDVDKLIEAGNAKINQLEVYKSSAPVKAGDLISVRGHGRFRFEEVGGITRKNRCWVQISIW